MIRTSVIKELISTTYSTRLFQRKNRLIKETYKLKQLIHNNNICFECKIKILSPEDNFEDFFGGDGDNI